MFGLPDDDFYERCLNLDQDRIADVAQWWLVTPEMATLLASRGEVTHPGYYTLQFWGRKSLNRILEDETLRSLYTDTVKESSPSGAPRGVREGQWYLIKDIYFSGVETVKVVKMLDNAVLVKAKGYSVEEISYNRFCTVGGKITPVDPPRSWVSRNLRRCRRNISWWIKKMVELWR
jgi:hypothetical protein